MLRFSLWITLILMVLPVASEEVDGYVPPTFTVGVQDFYYPPHSFIEEGRYAGFGRDVLDLFASHRGYRFVYVPQPYIRNVVDLLGGKIDFQYPDDSKWLVEMKLPHTIFYSNGIVGYMDGVNRNRADLGKPLEELKRMVMPIGWTAKDYEPLVTEGKLIINQVGSVQAVIAMVLKGRVDGAYLNADVVNYHFASMGREGDVAIDTTLPYSFGHFTLSSKKHPAIIEEFNAFLNEQADAVASLKEKYHFKYDKEPSVQPFTVN
ncbi:substrate-binding periplasmic protein [Shewanella sp.]|uniref:substrate-binding periplasmic protein n=1 Tax=Shewanella sp. TaxID=50422 RepID=UPI0035658099